MDVIFEGDNCIRKNATISYSIVGGVPAKALRIRFAEDEIRIHEKTIGKCNTF